jgi:hypothetical protein
MYIYNVFNYSLMSKFKRVMVFTSGEVLKTRKGELTDWTFISESHSNPNTGRRYVNAKCKCGREKTICINNVRCGNSMCCGKSPCGKKITKKRDVEVGYRSILYVYKKHAKDRGFTFDLDYDYFKELTKGNCFYCGIEPLQIYQLKDRKTGKIRSGIPITYNGIDRVNSTKGYFNDNVVSCCKICNRAKSNLPLDEFKEWIKKVYLKTINTD